MKKETLLKLMRFNLNTIGLHVGIIAVALAVLMQFSSAAYTQALYNSCFQNIYQFGLCPINAIAYLPFIVEFCAFLIVHRKISPPSYALSFLSAAIISYLFFALVTSAGASASIINTYLSVSTTLTICWVAAYAYEVHK